MILAKREDSHMFFSTKVWKEIYEYFDKVQEYALGEYAINSHSKVVIEESPQKDYATGYHKHCIIQLVLKGTYSLKCAPMSKLEECEGYDQEMDQVLFCKGTLQEYDMKSGELIILSPKEAYTPNSKNFNRVATFKIPYYLLLETKEHVEISCFSLIHRFTPENAKRYPIMENWTVNDVIDSLGIDREVVRVAFINDKAVPKTTRVEDSMKISLFPGIGGG